jgi:hypothetical protein
VANVLGGGVAKAAGSDGVAHAEAGYKPSVEDVPEVEVKSLGERKAAEYTLLILGQSRGGWVEEEGKRSSQA